MSTFTAATNRVSLEVVGKRPGNEPYLWVADEDGNHLGTFPEDQMRALRDAITEAIRRRPPASEETP